MISHDRYFLDVTIDRTVEIWNKRLTIYQGNYTKYLSQKDERRAQLQAAYRNQRDQIEHLEAFINRFRAQATKAKQVQSRIKELEKIERIEIPEDEPVIHFKFPQPPPSGRMVVEAEGLSKSYGAKQVLSNVRFSIERGDRVALVGVNGAGKSTLIKLLTGAEAPTAGQVRLGHNVVAEYFAQDQYKVLDGDARMLDDISRAALKVPEQALRSLLGCFLFSGDDVFKPLGVLSGGERNRYALARILVSPSNFLLLDEPTNHLDMRAKDVLLEAIAAFSGTVVFVSHDRYFIDRLATRVLEVADGAVTSHEGNYEDYLRWKEAQAAGVATTIAATPAAEKPTSTGVTIVIEGGPEPTYGSTSSSARQRRLNPIKQKQMEERCAFLEEEIPRIEAAVAHTEEELGIYVSAAAGYAASHRSCGGIAFPTRWPHCRMGRAGDCNLRVREAARTLDSNTDGACVSKGCDCRRMKTRAIRNTLSRFVFRGEGLPQNWRARKTSLRCEHETNASSFCLVGAIDAGRLRT